MKQKRWPVPSCQNYQLPLPGQAGSFWEDRGDRRHAGVDIYAPPDSEVVATEDGIVLDVSVFTSPERLPYWNITYCVTVQNAEGMVFRYAEMRDATVKKGDRVVAGQILGHVGTVLDLNKIDHRSPPYIQRLKHTRSPSMLHFEMYRTPPNTQEKYLGGNFFSADKPDDLVDPLPYLRSTLDQTQHHTQDVNFLFWRNTLVDKTLLDALFQPKSIAVVGASTKPGKIGYTVTDRLIKDGYPGPIYPINPGASELLGLKVYPSVSACPGPVDAAVIVVPAEAVKDALLDCAQKGVKGIILITSGFAEIGEKELEQEIVRIAHENNMRILGPNIVGILSNTDKMNASFCPFLPFPGRAALLSQSGALVIAIDAATYSRRVGFDKLVSLGNMADVDFTDCVEWLAQDENTSCISLYIEGFRDGRRFMDVARKAGKPIIALKAGVSAHGAAAAASHTGSLAGAVKVYGAAFTQCGVVQASDLDNLFDRVLALSLQPPMRGDNLLIITNGGGIGVLATDAAERCGIPLKFAPPDVQAELKKHMPVFGSAKNPVDITGMAGPDWYLDAVRYALTHPWLDGLAVLYCETAQTEPLEIAKTIRQAVTESGVTDKPVCACFVGGERSLKAMQWLVESGIPAYAAPDTAVNAMAALYEYGQMRAAVAANDIPSADPAARDAALKIIQQARADGRTALTEIEAKQVFTAYGMPVTATRLAKSEDEAAALAKQTGFPLVLKIVSPDIIHKSDAGGVKVNLKDEAAVRQAYRDILQNAKAYKADANIHGVAVQEMAEWGAEVILGSVNDPSFGPTVMFGLGGIFVEALKDVTFRVAPIGVSQAAGMMSEIRGAPILAGVRGEKPRDRQAMAAVISRYSQMVTDLMDEIAETDANPVLLYEEGKGLKVVDARIILKKK